MNLKRKLTTAALALGVVLSIATTGAPVAQAANPDLTDNGDGTVTYTGGTGPLLFCATSKCDAPGDDSYLSTVAGNYGVGSPVIESVTFTSVPLPAGTYYVGLGGDPNAVLGPLRFGLADEAAPAPIAQSVPIPKSGSCSDVVDTGLDYGTGLKGGWGKAWEGWVNPTLNAAGERTGGWACSRTLIYNTSSAAWQIAA